MPELVETLQRYNPWWVGGTAPALPAHPRRGLGRLLAALGGWPHYAHLLVGPRRAGKTTLLLHAVERLRRTGIADTSLLLVPGDALRERQLSEILGAYRELVAPEGTVYCFIDEGHWLPEWSVEVKVMVDRRDDCRFVVTGSSATLLFHQTAEALVGRCQFHALLPMTLGEWLTLRGCEVAVPRLPEGLNSLERLYEPPLHLPAQEVQAAVESELGRYLIWGGLPEQFELDIELSRWHRNIEETFLGVALLRDVISRFGVRDSGRLELLVRLLAEKSGLPLPVSAQARDLALKPDTVHSYLAFLEHARLILPCSLFTRNLPKRLRRPAKYYLIDSGLLCALHGVHRLTPALHGMVLEQAVALHLHAAELRSGRPLVTQLRYWRYRHEVDFVLQLPGLGPQSLLPVEVKWRGQISERDLKGMAEFMELQNSSAGVVVTRNTFARRELAGRPLYLIPAALFLLLAGAEPE